MHAKSKLKELWFWPTMKQKFASDCGWAVKSSLTLRRHCNSEPRTMKLIKLWLSKTNSFGSETTKRGKCMALTFGITRPV